MRAALKRNSPNFTSALFVAAATSLSQLQQVSAQMERFIERLAAFPRTAIISARIDSATSPTGVVTALAYPFARVVGE
jgi:hypothetical protein